LVNYYNLFILIFFKYKDIIIFIIIIIINLSRFFYLFYPLDLDILPFDFINKPDNSSGGYSHQYGSGSSGGGGGSGHEQHIYRTESGTAEDNDNTSSSKPKTFRERILAKPSDDAEINTAEEAINHIEALKAREINLRYIIAKHPNISRDIKLRDLDISFKKPLSPIAKYLDNCRKIDDPRSRIFYKSSPGNTPVYKILDYLKNKLSYNRLIQDSHV
jgi:hypothetical protein